MTIADTVRSPKSAMTVTGLMGTPDHMIDILTQLASHKLIPVIALEEVEQATSLADALVAGGLPVAEITFRTDAAEASIKAMADRGDMIVGAGTVLTPRQVDQAVSAGAQFIVSPGFNPRVVKHCLELGIPIVPGVSNPTDIDMALELGIHTVKFFPAEAFGGLKTLKAISAPYGMMQFVPTGGINASNVRDYLAFPKVLACGGSWMVAPKLYADGDFMPVQTAVSEAVALVRQ